MATTSDASVITLGNLKKYNDNLKSTILDPMDAEVKANAADITGIEALTYGTGKQKFVEKSDGSYTSPALIEIQHEMETNTTAISTLNDKVDGLHPVTWSQLTGKPFATLDTKNFTVTNGALKSNIATDSAVGVVKGGRTVVIGSDGTLSVSTDVALKTDIPTITTATDDDINAIFSA